MTDSTLGVTRREALKRGVVLGGATAVWAIPSAQAFAMSTSLAQATSAPAQGCTPGYWKNHTDSWPVGIRPDDKISGYFSSTCAEVQDLLGKTLLDGLRFKGGTTLAGAAQILLRAAIAALLNANHTGVSGYYGSNLIAEVDTVLASVDPDDPCDLNRDAILGLATSLDNANNAGCPLN